jgi:hypothetical protein
MHGVHRCRARRFGGEAVVGLVEKVNHALEKAVRRSRAHAGEGCNRSLRWMM